MPWPRSFPWPSSPWLQSPRPCPSTRPGPSPCSRSAWPGSPWPSSPSPSSPHLKKIVLQGDYGSMTYNIPRIYKKVEESKDRYILGGFSWKTAVNSDAPALLFRDACNDVTGFRGKAQLPIHKEHLLAALDRGNMLEYIKQGVLGEWNAGRYSPEDQFISKEPVGYYSKLRFKREKAYAFPPNTGCRQATASPQSTWITAALLRTSLRAQHSALRCGCFFPKEHAETFRTGYKTNSFNRMLDATTTGVLIQRPGDVVCLNNLVYHAVLLVYQPGIPDDDRWRCNFGDMIIRSDDRLDSFKYITRAASGIRRGSHDAWDSLLSAYCFMKNSIWDPKFFEEEKAQFLASLPLDPAALRGQTGARAKHDKRRRMKNRMASLRMMKKKKADSVGEEDVEEEE
ncbi:hypothetical protein V7S43_003844 [Phytophthora oleae]|uniref:JmjC domain-containing protein n=1 Tax=Phytophthora oleae TaxID=2107226 RepID=A0ABD3G0C2_9STRA